VIGLFQRVLRCVRFRSVQVYMWVCGCVGVLISTPIRYRVFVCAGVHVCVCVGGCTHSTPKRYRVFVCRCTCVCGWVWVVYSTAPKTISCVCLCRCTCVGGWVCSTAPKTIMIMCLCVQVYRAVLKETGEDVAVKVQRPGVEPNILRDLFIFRTLASFFDE